MIVARSLWDEEGHVATAHITVVERTNDGTLVRRDLTLTQRCYSESEIRHALDSAGFSEITVYDGVQDLGYGGIGRAFFVAS